MKHSQFFVFDIETVGLPIESFDEAQQEYLLRGAQTDEERDKKIREFALAPMTARVACVCLRVMKWEGRGSEPVLIRQGALALDETLGDGETRQAQLSGGAKIVFANERQTLHNFWKTLNKDYNAAHLVSFNGMDFDAPFLTLRSAALGVRPSRAIAAGKPWEIKEKHIDLLKELTLHAHGSQTNSGATRKYNFDFYARAFGVESPKAHGVHGGNVAELYAAGQIMEIAEYCMRDVAATWELFMKWHEYLYFGGE